MNQDLIEKIFKNGIVYISPQYKDGVGDTTLVCTEKEEILIEKNIKSVVLNLAKHKFLDLKESKNYYRDLLDRGRNIPLVFNERTILFGFKTRIPIGKNDGAMTYINPAYIEKFDLGTLHLQTGDQVLTLSSTKTIKRALADYRFVVRDLRLRA